MPDRGVARLDAQRALEKNRGLLRLPGSEISFRFREQCENGLVAAARERQGTPGDSHLVTEAFDRGGGVRAQHTQRSYEQGEWAVIFKTRRRRGGRFSEEQFLPIAFSVWDGFHRERGNKRGLTQWQYLYLEPRERPSPWGPMLRAGLGVLGLELLVIAWARRRRRAGALPAREPEGPAGAEPARRPA